MTVLDHDRYSFILNNGTVVHYPLYATATTAACKEAWYQNMWYTWLGGELPNSISMYGIAQVNHFFTRMLRLRDGSLLCEVSTHLRSIDKIVEELHSTGECCC
jgi:hypothetical protein